MARQVMEVRVREEGKLKLVQDRRDNPERTDRWFVELTLQVRFTNEADAREFLTSVDARTTRLPGVDP